MLEASDHKPLFSIVMVNYNSCDYLEQAIVSVLCQSFDSYEFIIVDGGSTDKSVDIIKKYSDRISWWISEPDKGQSDAFNKGFAQAKGEFFVWLNADDLMLPGTLALLAKEISLHPLVKWFALNTVYIDRDNRIWRAYKTPNYSVYVLRNGFVESGGPSMFFHHTLFEQYGPFIVDYHFLMDTDLWLKFAHAGNALLRITSFGWAFRDHNMSKTSSSLKGRPSDNFILERQRVRENNRISPKWYVLLYQRICRYLYSYPISLYYTMKFKGKSVYDVFMNEKQD